MIINKIDITAFGMLENRQFDFSDGLNLLYGSNESGKTTVLSFVKFMLYGTKIHKDYAAVAFKEKYMPWSGKPLSGSLTLTDENGQRYIITRFVSDARSTLKIINESTGADITDKDALRNPGKYFTSLGEEAFSSIAFLSSLTAAVKNDRNGELLTKLSNISQTGTEEISYQSVSNKINEEILSLSSNKRKNAILPMLQNEISETKNKITYLKKTCLEYEKTNDEICELESKKSEFEHELNQQKAVLSSEADVLKLKEAADAVSKINSDFSMRFSSVSDLEKISVDKYKVLINKIKFAKTAGYFCMLAAAIFVILFVYGGIGYRLAFGACAVVSVLLCLSAMFFARRSLQKTDNIKSILKKYNCKNAEEFKAGLERLKQIQEEKERILKKIGTNIFDDNCKKTLNDFTFLNNSDKIGMVSDKLNEINTRLAVLKSSYDKCQNCATELMEAEENLGVLENEMQNTQKRLKSLKIALEILNSSFDEAKSIFAPSLAECAGEIFSYITSGKYTKLKSDEHFTVKLKSAANYNNADFYSRGTCEQLYLALRLALCKTAVKEIELPVFLDDAFCTYDDDRLFNVLRFIKNESSNRQIFISSCRSSEFLFFRNEGINIITL